METKKNHTVYFVSGIDTGIGKSYATGWLASQWQQQGIRVITQKLVQTGNEEISEDIELHRRIMHLPLLPEDEARTTMPEIFSYPCSPHLASERDGRPINFEKIEQATRKLANDYEAVLLEGAGGLMVPLTRQFLTIDYVAAHHYPVILVTSGRLGSINHTLLSIEALEKRQIPLHMVIYNLYEDRDGDPIIRQDTKEYIRQYLAEKHPETRFIEMPVM